jgi:hypothetical protein
MPQDRPAKVGGGVMRYLRETELFCTLEWACPPHTIVCSLDSRMRYPRQDERARERSTE